jgi:hypothetical protein
MSEASVLAFILFQSQTPGSRQINITMKFNRMNAVLHKGDDEELTHFTNLYNPYQSSPESRQKGLKPNMPQRRVISAWQVIQNCAPARLNFAHFLH